MTRQGDSGFRARLQGGETLGGWCSIAHPLTAEIVGRAGFDWVCIDAQHGAIDRGTTQVMLQGLDAAGCPAIVRVPRNDAQNITEALDSGAAGVLVPLVNNVEDAQAAARAVRYPPFGSRSFGPSRAAIRDVGHLAGVSDAEVVCAVQIETVEAIENVQAIAAVPGVDVLLVGPADLALSLGFPVGSVTERVFREACRKVVRACDEHGAVPGMFCGTLDAVAPAREDGFRMLSILSDIRMLRGAAAEALRAARAGVSA